MLLISLKKTEKKISKIGISIDFSDLTPKAQASKAKIGSWKTDQIIKLCTDRKNRRITCKIIPALGTQRQAVAESLKLTWSAELFPGQLGCYTKKLSLKKKLKREGNIHKPSICKVQIFKI